MGGFCCGFVVGLWVVVWLVCLIVYGVVITLLFVFAMLVCSSVLNVFCLFGCFVLLRLVFY